MCLPHCPTYSLAQSENESPRGRLVLGKALLLGDVEETDKLAEYIDHCLMCRSCEKSCPSGVKFGDFMDGLRTHISNSQHTKHDFADTLVNKDKRRALNKKLWLGQRSGALSIGKLFLSESDTTLINSLPKIERFQPLAEHYPAKGAELSKVMLFTGCNTELLGNSLVLTAIDLLTTLGVSVDIPEQQGCCGALSRHSGDAETANNLETNNITAFDPDSDTPIVSLASGCGASLLDYDSIASRIVDINHFIVNHLETVKPEFSPLSQKVLLHTPCSMKNVMRQDDAVRTLLNMIPQLEVTAITSQQGCCGAAGTYMYEYKETAEALREPIVNEINAQAYDVLVTTNIGCAMHIQAGAKIEILHPIELLAKTIKL